MNNISPTNSKDISSNPEDIKILDNSPNSINNSNTLQDSNSGILNSEIPKQTSPDNLNSSNKDLGDKPKINEEIKNDNLQNDETGQNEQKEKPSVIESKDIQNEPKNEKESKIPKSNGKYKIMEFGGPVILPEGYSTDEEDEFNAIQILNQDRKDWKLKVNRDNIKIYSKLYKIINEEGKEVDNIMFFTEATINCPAYEVNRKLNIYSLREKWDKALKKGKLLKEEKLPNDLNITEYYLYIKMPFIFSDRDAVLKQKTWNNYLGEKDCYLTHKKSMEHPDLPPKDNPVRATYENFGSYIKPINENQCKLYSIAKFDMKISAPIFMMEGTGSEGQAKSVKEFITFCEK